MHMAQYETKQCGKLFQKIMVSVKLHGVAPCVVLRYV